MYNYNVINPVNIHYRKYPQNDEGARNVQQEKPESQVPTSTDDNGQGRRFPNGNKVAIDYTKNQINIAQVFQDFRSTIAAINTPDDIKEEVEAYLEFSAKETQKENPSRDIVLANLKNAARITDKYIEDSLKKPSRVVQDWVDALFLQKINLKIDPNEVNEDFRVKIPPKKAQAQEAIQSQPTGGLAPLEKDTVSFNLSETKEVKIDETPSYGNEIAYITDKSYIESSKEIKEAIEPEIVELAEEAREMEQELAQASNQDASLYGARTENEALAKDLILSAKKGYQNGFDTYTTLKMYDEALELLQGSDNVDLKSAVYFERAKVFDNSNYAELALIDYNKATKGNDGNLKTQAHIKMGNIYDDYVQIDPAMYQYSKAIETSEEVGNLQGKTKALRHLASMFAGIYDSENTEAFSDLALESAKETKNPKTIANTYLEVANNYRYIGEDNKALQVYSSFAQDEDTKDDYEALARNYMEASELMDKKGNKKKSYALMLKSKEYQRLARLKRSNA